MRDTDGTAFLKLIAYFNIIVVTIVLIDFFMPINENEVVVYEDWYSEVNKPGLRGRATSRVYIKSTNGAKFYLSSSSSIPTLLKPKDTFYIKRTPLFKANKSITFESSRHHIFEKISLFDISFFLYTYISFALLSFAFLFLKNTSIVDALLGVSLLGVITITGAYFLFY